MVDRQDHVLLYGPGVLGPGLAAGQHEEVIGGKAQVVTRLDGRFASAQPVRGGQDRRHHRAEAERLVGQFLGTDVVGRTPAELGAEERHGGPQHVEWRAAPADSRQHSAETGREGAALSHFRRERGSGGRIGELAAEQEMPGVLERALLGQLDGGVLPVVEETLLAPHVADGRLGHHHTFEPRRDVAALLAGRPDACHRHEIAERHDPHTAATLDHRQVAVVVRGQAGPRRVGAFVGAQHVGAGGHPEADLLTARSPFAGRRPQQVALGEDADDLAVIGHHHRAGRGLLHGSGRPGQGLVVGARHRGGGHEITHDGFHTSHYDALSLRL